MDAPEAGSPWWCASSKEGWGTKVVDRLAKDLGNEFPGAEGFSLRNLRSMRSFAEAWPDSQILQLAAKLPWGHHMVLLDRLKDGQSREWYLRASIEHGWSRNVLIRQIEAERLRWQGQAVADFDRTLSGSAIGFGTANHQRIR